MRAFFPTKVKLFVEYQRSFDIIKFIAAPLPLARRRRNPGSASGRQTPLAADQLRMNPDPKGVWIKVAGETSLAGRCSYHRSASRGEKFARPRGELTMR